LVIVKFTNGFGNNLFQYIAGRLLAESHGKELGLILPFEGYYGLKEFNKLGLKYDLVIDEEFEGNYIKVTEKNYNETYDKKYKDYNLELDGYFEDFKIYLPYISKIKDWFPEIKKRNNNDLVFHLRLGDRLYLNDTYKSIGIVKPKDFIETISKCEYENIFIVTDMPLWEEIDEKTLSSLSFHQNNIKEVKLKIAIKYFNSIFNSLNDLEPIVCHRKQNNGSVSDHFSFLRTFNNIIFQHSTTAWWASVLSEATSIGVYGPWRPFKGNGNKNLSDIPLPGWYKWN